MFGNQGALFLNALTMFDHRTESVWAQVWGKALFGQLEGRTLELVPASMVPWATWRADHPHTLVLSTGSGSFRLFREAPRDDFVIGIVLGNAQRAYQWRDASRLGAVNDRVGDIPIVVVANPSTRSIAAYGRDVGDRVLSFQLEGERLVDEQTRSHWNAALGLAIEGPLRGTALKTVPWSPAFDWAWRNHYPQTTFYRPQR